MLDGRAVDDLIEAPALEWPVENVPLDGGHARMPVLERGRHAVERDDVVPTLRGRQRQKADIRAEVERRSRPVRQSRKAERPLDPPIAY